VARLLRALGIKMVTKAQPLPENPTCCQKNAPKKAQVVKIRNSPTRKSARKVAKKATPQK